MVEGEVDLGSEVRKFVKEVDAPNERVAREHALKLIGSAHGRKRNQVKIASVKKG
ncbi:MAG: 50S ribosomal protein L18Ae [Candidatus ainarchaeum sp.]|nr:50S ribosomal protein L18Ae [Candidatus ainarchaeum sp.]